MASSTAAAHETTVKPGEHLSAIKQNQVELSTLNTIIKLSTSGVWFVGDVLTSVYISLWPLDWNR